MIHELKRIAITGMGIISCIGKTVQEVVASLHTGKSGISFNPSYQEMGMRSLISGSIDLDPSTYIDRKHLRFMADAAIFAYLSLQQAIEDAGLTPAQVSHPMTGLIAGSGGASSINQIEAADILRSRGIKRIGPYRVTRCMGNTVSACLAPPFGIKGMNMSISSACSTSAHCISMGADQIRLGNQKIVFAGGGEEENWAVSCLFDAMGALSTGFNDRPASASRPWDKDRDGFVIAGGGGFLVLEEWQHAEARGADIYAELISYAANSDGGESMVAPNGEGAVRCMQAAVKDPAAIDYINAHATSTPVGDTMELQSIKKVFGKNSPWLSSTKSLTGHSLGATGVQEAIYSLLMMRHNFVSGTLNLANPSSEAEGMKLPAICQDNVRLNQVMSNSFGFGGSNACLVFGSPA